MSWLLGCVFLIPLLSFNAAAQDEQEVEKPPWSRPVPSMPVDFDWMRLGSNEILKGELISMYDDKVDFDSDELGDLSIDWDDITEIRTHRVVSMRFYDGTTKDGKIFVFEDTVQLLDGAENPVYDRRNIISIAPSTQSDESLWTGSITTGLNVRSGNSDRLDYTLQGHARRLTSGNRIYIDHLSKFSEVDNEETENSHRLNASMDWYYSRNIFYRLVDFEYFRDPFQNISNRYAYSIGVGYQIYDQKDMEWSVTAGPSITLTDFDAVEEDEDDSTTSLGLQLGTRFEMDLTKDIDWDILYQVKIVSEDAGEYIHHLNTSIGVDLFTDFSLDVSVIVDRIDNPTKDADGEIPEKDDIIFTVGLEYEF